MQWFEKDQLTFFLFVFYKTESVTKVITKDKLCFYCKMAAAVARKHTNNKNGRQFVLFED